MQVLMALRYGGVDARSVAVANPMEVAKACLGRGAPCLAVPLSPCCTQRERAAFYKAVKFGAQHLLCARRR